MTTYDSIKFDCSLKPACTSNQDQHRLGFSTELYPYNVDSVGFENQLSWRRGLNIRNLFRDLYHSIEPLESVRLEEI